MIADCGRQRELTGQGKGWHHYLGFTSSKRVYDHSGSNSESGYISINRVYLEGENELFIDMFMG